MEIKLPKIAFVIGHHVSEQGAYSPILRMQEWMFFKELAENHLGALGTILTHDHLIFSYTQRQRAMAKRTVDFDLVIELHFDAFNGSAFGCHAKYWHSNEQTKHLAGVLCDCMEDSMNIKNRGLVPVYNRHRDGNGFIIEQKVPAILFECFFGDAESDCRKFNGEKFRQIFIKIINEMTKDCLC